MMCQIEGFGEVYWLDVRHGMLTAAGDDGNIASVNYEGEIIWKKKGGQGTGWMVNIFFAKHFQNPTKPN